MPNPYSADLRERVLGACRRGEGSRRHIAQRFQVSESTLYEWRRLEREEGRCVAKPHAGGLRGIVDEGGEGVLRTLVAADTDGTLAEYAKAFTQETGKAISVPVVCQALKRMNLRRKKRHCGPASEIARMYVRREMSGQRISKI
jgi:transposase